MNTLPDLLEFVVTTLQVADISRQVDILSTDQFSDKQFVLKIRAYLQNDDVLQIRYYYNHSHVDYAYQLIRSGIPFLRWDNKEHFPNLASYPHHFHNPSGTVEDSLLCGDPAVDIFAILDYLTVMVEED